MKTKHIINAVLLAAVFTVSSSSVLAEQGSVNGEVSVSWLASILSPLGLMWEEGIYF